MILRLPSEAKVKKRFISSPRKAKTRMENENKLKLGLPKGSLEERTVELFKTAGFDVRVDGRSYYPKIDDPEIACVLIRAQEIPRYVESGVIDAGITGQDLILESKASVVEVVDLGYTKGKLGKTKLVLAVPENSNIKSVKDLAGKTVATEFVEITKDYLRKNKVAARVEFSWGATEIKPPHLADAIVELTDTGTTLRAHNLKIFNTSLKFLRGTCIKTPTISSAANAPFKSMTKFLIFSLFHRFRQAF